MRGIAGWSDYIEGYGAQELTGVIHAATRTPRATSTRADCRDRERIDRHQGQGVGRAGKAISAREG
jgi:hypothetical protein